MKIRSSILFVLATCAPLLRAELFFRPTFLNVNPSTEGYSSVTAFGLVMGSHLGKTKNQEISAEWGYVKFDEQLNFGAFSVSKNETYIPYLLNYRVHFGKNARFYAGPSVGVTYSKVSASASLLGVSGSAGISKWLFSWGGSSGVLFKLTERIDFDIGYRYLATRGGSANINLFGTSISIPLDDSHANVFYCGLGFRF